MTLNSDLIDKSSDEQQYLKLKKFLTEKSETREELASLGNRLFYQFRKDTELYPCAFSPQPITNRTGLANRIRREIEPPSSLLQPKLSPSYSVPSSGHRKLNTVQTSYQLEQMTEMDMLSISNLSNASTAITLTEHTKELWIPIVIQLCDALVEVFLQREANQIVRNSIREMNQVNQVSLGSRIGAYKKLSKDRHQPLLPSKMTEDAESKEENT